MLNWREVIKSIDEQRKNQNILLFGKLLHMNQNNITSSKSLSIFNQTTFTMEIVHRNRLFLNSSV